MNTSTRSLWQPVLKSATYGALNKGLAMMARLLTIPLLINHLGVERYGIWMTIASFSSYIMIFELGIGSSLVNRITWLYTRSDRQQAEAYISTALLLLTAMSIFCMAVAVMVLPLTDWQALFKLSSPRMGEEAAQSVLTVLVMFLLQLPFSIIMKVPYTMQAGWLGEVYQIVGTITMLVGIVVSIALNLTLATLTFFLAGSAVFASAGLLCHLVVTKRLRLTIPSAMTLKLLARELGSTSLDFMLIQTASLLIYSLQFTVLAVLHGAGTVAAYGLITQVLMALQLPFVVVQQPMWTRMAQLYCQGDLTSVTAMFGRFTRYAFWYSAAASCIIIFLINPVLERLVHEFTPFALSLRICFALACSLGLVAGGGVGTVLLSLNLSRPMAIIALLQLVMFVAGVWCFVPAHGAVAMISSVNWTYCLVIPCSYWLLRKKLLERQSV